MDVSDMIGWIFIVIILIGGIWVCSILIPDAYHEIKSYQVMRDQCDMNPDICFCEYGECSIKSSCSYTTINDNPMTGGCNHTKICEMVTKANWKEGIWEYGCNK